MNQARVSRYALPAAVVLLILAAVLAFCYYTLLQEHEATSADLAAANERIAGLETKLADTESALAETIEDRDVLSGDLAEEKNRNEEFENQIEEIAGTVGVLDKLSKTDEELLQKYSKVYFLNEHYVPENISPIDKEYLYNESLTKEIHSKVEPYLEKMLDDAKDDEVDIWVVSAYRSWGEQANLKGQYTITYGTGANTFSADQGYSEHQLGTTLDFTTTGLGGGLAGFQNTAAYEWLLDNAHKYGFTLSYPTDNTYYVFEPWHWRFVGEELAGDLYDAGAYFYDWDQRKINGYLVSIFD